MPYQTKLLHGCDLDYLSDAYLRTVAQSVDVAEPTRACFTDFTANLLMNNPDAPTGSTLQKELELHPLLRTITHFHRTDTLEYRRFANGKGPQAAGSPWDRAVYEPDEGPAPCVACLESDIGSFPVTMVHFGPDTLYVIPRS